MSSTERHRQQTIRREIRLSRSKTAAALMPYFLGEMRSQLRGRGKAESVTFDSLIKPAAQLAVEAADALLAEIDRTAPEPPPPSGPTALVE